MFIHLGGDKIIRSSELVAIFDISIEKMSKTTKSFIQHAQKERNVETIGEEESKSVVVTKTKIYYSPISSATLKRRADEFHMSETEQGTNSKK